MLPLETIHKLDPSGMREHIRTFYEQVEEAVAIGRKFQPKTGAKNISRIVLAGMGGSAIGGDLLRTYLGPQVRVPLIVNRHYTLPAFVDRETLVIISSYSGNTEETLSAYGQAVAQKASVLCITSGGAVAERAKELKHPTIIIPGGMQPRAALGYSFFPLLYALGSMGYFELNQHEVDETITVLKTLSGESIDMTDRNRPFSIAKRLHGKPVIVWSSSDLLEAVGVRWRGQINENAKHGAYSALFPELNHNEIVGWEHPAELLRQFVIVLLKDRDDHTRVMQRMAITREVIGTTADAIIDVTPSGEGRLARMFSMIHTGDWVSFYLAMLNEADPTPVERIQYLKRELDRVKE
jgi:glucose/mannose-6-phosphate isomerase